MRRCVGVAWTTWILALLYGSLQAIAASNLLVLCPVQRVIDAVQIVDDSTYTIDSLPETKAAVYFWTEVEDKESLSCVTSAEAFSDLSTSTTGRLCLSSSILNGMDGIDFCVQGDSLNITAYSSSISLSLAETQQVSVCNVTGDRVQLLGDLADGTQARILIAETGCIAISADEIPGYEGAESTQFSSAYIEAAGFNFTTASNASADESSDLQACSVDDGYSSGLTAQFYSSSDGTYSIGTPLSLSFGTSNSTTCTVPQHAAAGTPWLIDPNLPTSFDAQFGAAFSGDILVENSTDWNGLGGWELLCLQFNDAAQMDVDGVTRLSATRALDLGLGYREICKAVQLVEGWHSITIRYMSAKPNPAFSILKFFALDATGSEGESIQWQTNTTLCSPAEQLSDATLCTLPPDACSFRTSYGCGSGLLSAGSPLPDSITLPYVSTVSSAVQYTLPNFAGFGTVSFTPTIADDEILAPEPSQSLIPSPFLGPSFQVAPIMSPLFASPVPGLQSYEPASSILGRPPPAESPAFPPAMLATAPASSPLLQIPGLGPLAPASTSESPEVSVPEPQSPSPVLVPLPSQIPSMRPISGSVFPTLPPETSPPPSEPPAVAPSPVLTEGPSMSSCTASPASCWVALDGLNTTSHTIHLACQSDPGAYITRITYPAGFASGWLTVQNASANGISLVAATEELSQGRFPALLELLQSEEQGTMTLPIKVFLVLVGPSEASFHQVTQKDDTSAYVSAAVSLSTGQLDLSIASTVQLISSEDSKTYFYGPDSLSQANELQYSIMDTISSPVVYHLFDYSLLLDVTHQVSLTDQKETYNCGALYAEAAVTVPSRPRCWLLAEDLAKRWDGTPITTGSQALVTLACTAPVQFCSDCLVVSGPTESSVTSLAAAQSSQAQAVHRMLVSWAAPYEGTLRLDVQASRGESHCSLDMDTSSSCSINSGEVPAVDTLQIISQLSIPSNSSISSFSYQCIGSVCRFEV